ncbi:MAG: ribonuclease J [Oscillospiraceae bacterium]|nr:ribonuclease J [Oscillospiraceae bacterium]
MEKRRYSRIDENDQINEIRAKAKKITQPAVPIRMISLGGLNEIGKNMTVFECQGDMIIVDCGSTFPDDEMYGIDLVIPDFTYVLENADRIRGLFITHGHEDHIGGLPYLLKDLQVPVYATRLTKGLIENKLEEFNMVRTVDLREIAPGDRIRRGGMTVVPIHVNHSIPDAVGFAIESPAGTVITTGDFKIDLTPTQGETTDLKTFAEYGAKGVLALLQDSTNSERRGSSASERMVGRSFETLFRMAGDRRIIIATFASNIYRIQQILDLALRYDRKVTVSGRSMIKNIEMAFQLGYLHTPKDIMIPPEEEKNYDPGQIIIITTGSQGEPLSALSRMSGGMHRQFSIGPDDFIIISATPIPGNEKMVTKVVNGLLKLGAEVIYESMYDVHVSGHAYQEEQKLMLKLIRPKYFIPVHGEYKHLKRHAYLAETTGMDPMDIHLGSIGEVLSISETGMKVEGTVPSGQLLIDGYGVGDVGSVVLRDRHHLSHDGLVVVVFSVSRETGRLLAGPDIVSRGFVYVKASEDLIAEARSEATAVLDRYRGYVYKDWAVIKAKIRDRVSNVLYKRTKRNPMVLPIVMEI